MRVQSLLAAMLLACAGSVGGQEPGEEPWDEEDAPTEDLLSEPEGPVLPTSESKAGRGSRSVSRLRWIRRSATAAGRSWFTGANVHMRTRLQAGNSVTVALTTEKDPGERDPLDFLAGYAEIRFPSGSGRMVLGDFRPGYGQGLVCSRWSGGPSGPDAIRLHSPEPIGYRSTYENGAMRGFHLEGIRRSCRIAVFGSMARYDAARDTSGRILRIDDEGIHVSQTQRGRADALRESALGFRLDRSAGRCRGGITALRSGFTPPFVVRTGGISGGASTAMGVDGVFSTRGLQAAGEIARIQGRLGWVAGTIFGGNRLRASIQGRGYAPGFESLHGSGPSAFGEATNERGVAAGLFWNSRPSSAFLTADASRHPGATSSLPSGSGRLTISAGVRHRPFRGFTLRWSGRSRWDRVYKNRELGVLPRSRQGLRLDAERRFGSGTVGRFRIEANRTGVGNRVETGGMAFGGVRIRWRSLQAEARATLFGIPSYENRMYEWESAPDGMVGTRILTGEGWKGYLVVSAEIRGFRPTLKLWRQWPTDGRAAGTECVFQVDLAR